MSESQAKALLEGPMERTHKVFTTTTGDVRTVGKFGPASNDVPAMVPADVAAELASTSLFRIEGPDAPAKKLTPADLKKAQPKKKER